MGRGLELGCEQCAFRATLYERVPFARDAEGRAVALERAPGSPRAGYWSDWLCGHCILPVRREMPSSVVAQGVDTLTGGETAEEPPMCLRCGQPLLTFDMAAQALADASHSRAWSDLHAEQAANRQVHDALDSSTTLRGDIESGDSTTIEALDQLALRVGHQQHADGVSESGDAMSDTMVGLDDLMRNAPDLPGAARILRERLRHSEARLAALETIIASEAELEGVPCPQCGTGQLIHWPIWTEN